MMLIGEFAASGRPTSTPRSKPPGLPIRRGRYAGTKRGEILFRVARLLAEHKRSSRG